MVCITEQPTAFSVGCFFRAENTAKENGNFHEYENLYSFLSLYAKKQGEFGDFCRVICKNTAKWAKIGLADLLGCTKNFPSGEKSRFITIYVIFYQLLLTKTTNLLPFKSNFKPFFSKKTALLATDSFDEPVAFFTAKDSCLARKISRYLCRIAKKAVFCHG